MAMNISKTAVSMINSYPQDVGRHNCLIQKKLMSSEAVVNRSAKPGKYLPTRDRSRRRHLFTCYQHHIWLSAVAEV